MNSTTSGQIYFITHFIILAAATYINIYLLMSRYLATEQYKKYIFWLFLLWMLSLAAIYLSSVILKYPPYSGFLFARKIMAAMVGFSMEFSILSLYKVAKEWYLKVEKGKKLYVEKMQAELSLLRSQLDAHFLFNTLNNLYLLVLNKSDKAPDAILMLSDLLSYNIYESRQEKVDIGLEIQFIENYINLQKLRLDQDQVVEFSVTGVATGNIEPLVLFNFIENTFKHAYGTVAVNGHQYYIYINIHIEDNALTLITVNGHQEKGDMGKEGVGIINAQKRLDLAYANNYSLHFDRSEQGAFKVNLKINGLI